MPLRCLPLRVRFGNVPLRVPLQGLPLRVPLRDLPLRVRLRDLPLTLVRGTAVVDLEHEWGGEGRRGTCVGRGGRAH
eukprot:154300-Chlamydomonas_euryale.AAC.1